MKGKYQKLLICCCAEYGHISRDKIWRASGSSIKAWIEVERCSDLCLLAVKDPDFMKRLAEEGTFIAACFPRVAKALFARAGSFFPGSFFDLRSNSVEGLLDALDSGPGQADFECPLPEYPAGWSAWFPLIDSQRCTDCGKCLDYCLFGVYSRQGGKVTVKAPENCKTNCPACARVCPSRAIMFPKHDDPVINGKQENSSDVETMNNLSAGNKKLYDILSERRRKTRKKRLVKD